MLTVTTGNGKSDVLLNIATATVCVNDFKLILFGISFFMKIFSLSVIFKLKNNLIFYFSEIIILFLLLTVEYICVCGLKRGTDDVQYSVLCDDHGAVT